MADIVLPHTFTDGPGNTASGEQVMDNFDAVTGQVNGNLDGDNMAPDAVENRMHGPFIASFSGIGAGSDSQTDVTHGLGSTAVTLVGAPKGSGPVSWGFSVVDSNTVRIYVQNDGPNGHTFTVRFYVLIDP